VLLGACNGGASHSLDVRARTRSSRSCRQFLLDLCPVNGSGSPSRLSIVACGAAVCCGVMARSVVEPVVAGVEWCGVGPSPVNDGASSRRSLGGMSSAEWEWVGRPVSALGVGWDIEDGSGMLCEAGIRDASRTGAVRAMGCWCVDREWEGGFAIGVRPPSWMCGAGGGGVWVHRTGRGRTPTAGTSARCRMAAGSR